MNPIDKKVMEALKLLKKRGDIELMQEFCDAIEMDKQTLQNVKIGRSHFRPYHIKNMCKKYSVNANWVFGLSDQFSRVTAEIRSVNNKVNNKVKKSV
jgi:DNA repair ATPase RecN